jgi:tetratricopeptide (TPR) repeat protein
MPRNLFRVVEWLGLINMQELDKLERLIRNGDKEKAFELIERIDFLTPELLINEAIYFGSNEEYDLLVAYLEIAEKIAKEPELKGFIRDNLAKSYVNRGATYANLKLYEKAIEDFNRAMEIDPYLAMAYGNRGTIWSYLKQFDKAIEDCNIAIIVDPKETASYFQRGWIYGDLGDLEKAIKDYSKAIELNPNYIEAYNNRGNAYALLKLYNEALEDFNKAIKQNPNFAVAYSNRGNAYYDLKIYDKAIKDCKTALKLNPKFVNAYFVLGSVYSALEEHNIAIENYSKAIELDPRFEKVYCNRAKDFSALGQYENAIEDCNKELELNPNDALAYNNRGSAYGGLKKYKKAIKDYNKAIEVDPSISLAYGNLGKMYLMINENLDSAINNLKKARKNFEEEYDKEEMLAYIEWAKARKGMNNKQWNTFREHMKEAKEIFENIKNPVSRWVVHSIEISYLDEKLDNALSIPNPTILSVFLDSVLSINEDSDLEGIKNEFIELCEDCKKMEKKFEVTNFTIGKRAIVDVEDIIHRDGTEILEGIKNLPNSSRKEAAINKLADSWRKLSSAIRALNGLSSYETQNIILQRQIYEKISNTKEIAGTILKEQKELRKDHNEILKTVYKTKDILIKENVVSMKYTIEIKPPLISSISPVTGKFVIDIPIGNVTEEKMEEIESKLKNLTKEGKRIFLRGIEKIGIDKMILGRLKVLRRSNS